MGKETIKTLSTTWEQKMAERARSQQIKELQAELKAAAVAGREEKKKAAEDKKRRREENEAKNTTYQVLADPNSIKTMSKKQLKMIRKTEVSSRGITRLANPWGSGQEEGQRRQGHDGPATRRHAPAAKRQKRG